MNVNIKGIIMIKKGRIGLEDLGEGYLIFHPSRVDKYPKGGFAMYLQQGFLKLASETKFSVSARMLFFYMGVVEYDNRIKNYAQREISEMTGITQANISKATKELLEDGIIYKDGRDFYFNDEYILKGTRKYRVKPE